VKLRLMLWGTMALAACGGTTPDTSIDAGSSSSGPDAGTSDERPEVGASDAGATDAPIPLDATGLDDAFIQEPPPAPTCSPTPGTFTSAQSVTLLDSTPGATIHLTVDGTNPTPSSTVYTAPLPVAKTAQIRAMAVLPGSLQSNVEACLYTINAECGTQAPPSVTPPGGTYSNDFTAWLQQQPNAGSAFCYTLDGSVPNANSAGVACLAPSRAYDAATGIPIDGTVTGNPQPGAVTLEAIAIKPGGCPTAMPPVTYTLKVAPPLISPNSGKITAGTTVSFTSTTKGSLTFRYTTDGTTPSCSPANGTLGASFVTTGTPVHVQVVGCKAGYLDSNLASASYTF